MKRREEIITETLGCRQSYVDLKRPITPDDVADAFEKGAYWADDNPKWIRPIDEMPPVGINVLTRVIKGDGSVVYQVDRRASYEWVNLCHYDKITHWMRIRFKDEE